MTTVLRAHVSSIRIAKILLDVFSRREGRLTSVAISRAMTAIARRFLAAQLRFILLVLRVLPEVLSYLI